MFKSENNWLYFKYTTDDLTLLVSGQFLVLSRSFSRNRDESTLTFTYSFILQRNVITTSPGALPTSRVFHENQQLCPYQKFLAIRLQADIESLKTCACTYLPSKHHDNIVQINYIGDMLSIYALLFCNVLVFFFL